MNNDIFHNPMLQIVAWCNAQICYIISINVEAVYDVIFKGLSLISVAFIVFINIGKVIEKAREYWKKLRG